MLLGDNWAILWHLLGCRFGLSWRAIAIIRWKCPFLQQEGESFMLFIAPPCSVTPVVKVISRQAIPLELSKKRCSPYVVSTLDQRLRRWPDVETASSESLVFAVMEWYTARTYNYMYTYTNIQINVGARNKAIPPVLYSQKMCRNDNICY